METVKEIDCVLNIAAESGNGVHFGGDLCD